MVGHRRQWPRQATELVKMGYDYLAIGGMVPLRPEQIKSALGAVRDAIPKEVAVHILDLQKQTTCMSFKTVASTVLTPPRHCYEPLKILALTTMSGMGRHSIIFTAIRVPQVLTSPPLKRMVQAGKLELEEAVELEREAFRHFANMIVARLL